MTNISEEADYDTNTIPEDQLDVDDSSHYQDQRTNDVSPSEKANDLPSMDQKSNDADQRVGDKTVVDQEAKDTPFVDQQVNDTPLVDDTVTVHQNNKDASTTDQKATHAKDIADQESNTSEVEITAEELTKMLFSVRSFLIPRSGLTNFRTSGTTTAVKWHNADCSLQEFNLDFSKPEGQGKFGAFLSTCVALSKLRHPNIQQLWGFVSQEEKSTKPSASMITEILDLTLTKLLTDHRCNEIQTTTHIQICYDVAKAVNYLHSSKVSHLLIRSDCVQLTRDYHAKLCDITSSLLYQSGLNPEAKMINANYLPPDDEMLSGASGMKIDTFSAGVLFLQTITHVPPNPAPIDDTHCTEIERRQDHVDLVHSSHPLLTLIIACISNKPDDRPTDEEMCSLLETSLSTQD